MRTLLFAFTIFFIGFTSCKSTKSEEPQQQQEQELNTRNVAENALNDALKDIVKAFKNQDTTTLNKYINSEKGLYYVQSTQGSYSDCIHYYSTSKMLADSEDASEYEINPLKYMLDYFNNINIDEMEIITDDLFGVEACSFDEKGFFIDSNKADVKLLTDVYSMNIENTGDKTDKKELVKLGETQHEITKMVFVSDGEVTYTFYFTEENNKWSLTLLDLRDCDT